MDCARDKNIPIRIGVNAGSLEKDLQEKYGEPTPQALLESAVVFLIALLGACVLGTAASGWMQELLLATVDTGTSLTVSLQAGDIAQLLGIGGAVVGIGVLLSLIPVLRSNPKDILSRMEG